MKQTKVFDSFHFKQCLAGWFCKGLGKEGSSATIATFKKHHPLLRSLNKSNNKPMVNNKKKEKEEKKKKPMVYMVFPQDQKEPQQKQT